jgi:hypothetical protein
VAQNDPTRLRQQTLALFHQVMRHISRSDGERASYQELASLTKRSRWSGLVPELRLRGVYGFDQTVSQEGSTGIYPGDLTTRGGHDSLIEARLSFRLDRLVYGDQESSHYQRRRELRQGEEKRRQDAVQSLLVWLDARRRLADPDLSPERWYDALQDEESALLTLHSISQGWFQGELTLELLGYDALLHPAPVQTPAPSARERGSNESSEAAPTSTGQALSMNESTPAPSAAQHQGSEHESNE